MRKRRVYGILVLLAIIVATVAYYTLRCREYEIIPNTLRIQMLNNFPDEVRDVEKTRLILEKTRITKAVTVEQNKISWMNYKLTTGKVLYPAVIVTVLASLLTMSFGVKSQLETYIVKVNQYASFPILKKDLAKSPELAAAAVIAEQLRSQSSSQQAAHDTLLNIAKTLNFRLDASRQPEQRALTAMLEETPAPITAPTFHKLYHAGTIAPGKPLILGVDESGEMQSRRHTEIKGMLLAGWQGSGKTLSTAYLTTCLLVQYPDSHGYVIDPHKDHDEGLANYLRPLEQTGRLTIANPFDVPVIITDLNTHLEARLLGQESSKQLLFLVIDELSKLGRTDMFKDQLKPFLDRCTEETRKANILFFGAGQKWQARYFCNDASLRQSIPSLLCHKLKPSQARLLFEDEQEKKLVKTLSRPGEALLCTSHDADPSRVCVPLITRRDIQEVSQRLIANGTYSASLMPQGDLRHGNYHNEPPTEPGEPDGQEALTPERLKVLRTTHGMSQQALAELAQISLSKLKRYESANQNQVLDPDELNRILSTIYVEKRKTSRNVVHLNRLNRLRNQMNQADQHHEPVPVS